MHPQPPNFFTAGSPFLQHPLLTPARTVQEVDFLLPQLALPAGGAVLDVGCGFGRHAIELARRGYRVTGIDPSATMLAAARAAAVTAGVQVEWQQRAGQTFVAPHLYDAAICLFTTLGQVTATGGNEALLAASYMALAAGGRFVVEVPQRSFAVRHLRSHELFGQPPYYTEVTRAYDREKQRISETFRVVKEKQAQSYRLVYHLYSRQSLVAAVTDAGFREVAVYGGYESQLLTDESSVILLVAEK